MRSQKLWPGFLVRVAALAAAFAVPLSYGIFVQAGQVVAAQRSIQIEMRGSGCLITAYELLRDLLTLEPTQRSESAARRRDLVRFDATDCAKGVVDWPTSRSQMGHDALDEAALRHLAAAMVIIINGIGSRSNILYDPHPVVLNLGNAAAYDLPKAQTLIVASAGVRDSIDSARLDATATQLLLSTRYDITSAVSYAPGLAPVLTKAMQRSLFSDNAYATQLERWQRRGRPSARRRSLSLAVGRAIADTDAVYRLLHHAIDAELSSESSENARLLRTLWNAYAGALVLCVAFAWLLASYFTRRENLALYRLRQEVVRAQAESARDRAELELGIRQARFIAIFAESPLPIAISDLHGVVVESNRAYMAMVGPSVADGRRRLLLDTLSIEPSDALDSIYADFRNGLTATREVDVLLIDRKQEQMWCHAIVAPVAYGDGVLEHCSVMLQDVTDRMEREQRFHHGATHDYLTGLPNRASLIASLAKEVARQTTTAPRFALLFVDVDDFKSINDSLGHQAGDESLMSIANRLSTLVRDGDIVARYGGDEFVILLVDPLSVANAREIADRIACAFVSPLSIGAATVAFSLSVGVTVDRAGYTSCEEVLFDADARMYAKKVSGEKRLAKIRRPAAVRTG